MHRLFILFWFAISGHLGLGLCRSLVSVRIDTGEWIAVKEVARGLDYWLYPRPEILAASWCRSCVEDNVVQLSVRFWQEGLLESARDALRRQRWCSEEQPCRVAPFQATRIVLRHPAGKWMPLRRSVALSGVLPDVVNFAVRPVSDEGFSNGSAVPVDKLTSLEIDIQLAEEPSEAKASSKHLVITGFDLKLALHLLRAKQDKVMDQKNIQKLISVLLKMKKRHFDGAIALTPSLRTQLQQQLTTSSFEFGDDMKGLLPPDFRAKPGDLLFALKPLDKNERVSINIEDMENSRSITVGMRLHRAMTTTDPSLLNQNLSAPVSDNSNVSLLRLQVEKLALLAKAEHILDPAVMDLLAIDDCFEVKQKNLQEGLFYLRPLQRAVRCTKDGYLVVLNRYKDKTNFNLEFKNYEQGIGNISGSGYFIGLKALSQVSLQDDLCMVLKLYPWRLNIESRTVIYDSFTVSDGYRNYKLNYSTFEGSTLTDVFSSSRGQMFSTSDSDNDHFVGSCSKRFRSGNWFDACQSINLFGPYRPDGFNGMCSTGIAKSQGTMCSPLTGVQMLLRKKIHSPKSTKIVYSIIASPHKNCTSTLKLFKITEPGIYSITVGGGPGGRSPVPGTRPGGRGAKVSGVFHLRRGSTLALSAGCRGQSGCCAGHGGSASWAVLRPKGVLLTVAGGGGGAGRYYDPKENKGFTALEGMHGRATPEGGDAWWEPRSTATYDAKSILNPRSAAPNGRGKGWRSLREKFLTASSADVTSGGDNGNCDCGGGGGGFEGGHQGPDDDHHSGGGGGSLCNATEAKSCSVEAGGNMRPDGFVIVERHFCF